MFLSRRGANVSGQLLSKIAALKNDDKVAQPVSKIPQSASDSRVAFVFSLAKKRQKQRLSGI
jgi:hypothetical protein